ncbi:hypothetical protein BD779DRAFT_1671063 [Infundibulicybe gibba]|nr:hypothetical protein BD779DRAFT_1671063 [Infundibulicybe gibba]
MARHADGSISSSPPHPPLAVPLHTTTRRALNSANHPSLLVLQLSPFSLALGPLVCAASRLRSPPPVPPLTLSHNLSTEFCPLPPQAPHTPRLSPGGAALMHHHTRYVGREHSRVESAEEDDDFQPASNASALQDHSQTMPPVPPQRLESRISANRIGTLLDPLPDLPGDPHQLVLPPLPPPATLSRARNHMLSPLSRSRSHCIRIPSLAAPDGKLYLVLASMSAPVCSPRLHLALAATLELLPHTQPPSITTPPASRRDDGIAAPWDRRTTT